MDSTQPNPRPREIHVVSDTPGLALCGTSCSGRLYDEDTPVTCVVCLDLEGEEEEKAPSVRESLLALIDQALANNAELRRLNAEMLAHNAAFLAQRGEGSGS